MKRNIVTVLMLASLLTALIPMILRGYSATWTGFGDFESPDGDFIRGKTLWDWLELFIIPIFLAIAAFYLNRSEREAESQRADQRARLEHEIAADRQREAALQSYLDRMADSLLKENLRLSENEKVRNVARIRTLTVLQGLDEKRKGIVLLFLHESALITEEPIISLTGADLTRTFLTVANLMGAVLRGADLTEAILMGTNLTKANLIQADLQRADLTGAVLREASLMEAQLEGAKLLEADLREAKLMIANMTKADLRKAKLIGADLRGAFLEAANLEGAYLEAADLTGARLQRAKVSDEQLATVKSLEGAILPDGTEHD